MSDTLCLHLAHDSAELLKQSVARTGGEKGEEEEEKKINLGSISEGEGEDAATAAFISCTRHVLTSAGSA